MNTKHKSFLLPHHFQIVGWILFTIVLLWGMFVMTTWKVIDLNKYFIADKWFIFVMYTFLFLAAGLVGLSREKQEDEYISNIRASSLAIKSQDISELKLKISSLLTTTTDSFSNSD